MSFIKDPFGISKNQERDYKIFKYYDGTIKKTINRSIRDDK
jgi:hypothetical protein